MKKSRVKPAWRVCDNPRCNDWNDELEKIVVPYTILGESKSGKSYLVERNGWHGKRYQHYISKGEIFFVKEDAENALRRE
jgi:hypothetical protein